MYSVPTEIYEHVNPQDTAVGYSFLCASDKEFRQPLWVYDGTVFAYIEKEEKEVSDDLMKAINKKVSLEEFVPRYLNQAITFTRDDMGSDRAMMSMY